MRDKRKIIADLKEQASKERKNKKVLIFETSNKFQVLLRELGDVEANCFASLDDLMSYLDRINEESSNIQEEILDTIIGGGGI